LTSVQKCRYERKGEETKGNVSLRNSRNKKYLKVLEPQITNLSIHKSGNTTTVEALILHPNHKSDNALGEHRLPPEAPGQ
jgi:hypothetical protein